MRPEAPSDGAIDADDAGFTAGFTEGCGTTLLAVDHLEEEARLRSLRRLELLDAPEQPSFVRIVDLASTVLQAPVALVSLLDAERQWFLARHGLAARQTPREMAFCSYSASSDVLTVVNDALQDDRYRLHPMVIGEPYVRFYAGAPIFSPDGPRLGSLCVVDRRPREFGESQRNLLRQLAAMVEREIVLRRQANLCPLTGLFHRTAFLRLAEVDTQQARLADQALAYLHLELLGLDRVNRSLGVAAGDALLQAFTDQLRDNLKARDLVGRVGATEFGLLLSDCGDQEAVEIAERLRQRCSALFAQFATEDQLLALCGGVSALVPRDHSFMDLYYRADQATAEARVQGRCRIIRLLGI